MQSRAQGHAPWWETDTSSLAHQSGDALVLRIANTMTPMVTPRNTPVFILPWPFSCLEAVWLPVSHRGPWVSADLQGNIKSISHHSCPSLGDCTAVTGVPVVQCKEASVLSFLSVVPAWRTAPNIHRSRAHAVCHNRVTLWRLKYNLFVNAVFRVSKLLKKVYAVSQRCAGSIPVQLGFPLRLNGRVSHLMCASRPSKPQSKPLLWASNIVWTYAHRLLKETMDSSG